MKKIFLTIVLPAIIIASAILAVGSSCSTVTPPLPATCDISSVSKFMTLYNAYAGSDFYSYDVQVYEYTFKTNVNGSICAVGYQGHVNLIGLPAYKIELIDGTTNMVLSTGTYSFSNSARSYINITPVSITANQPYILRRTVTNNLGDAGNTKSHFKQIPSIFPSPFPTIINGQLTIITTKTYDQYSAASPYNVSVDGVLPCIDFVFN